MDYTHKENYITVLPDPNAWRNHANGNIIRTYAKYIKGHAADFGCNHGACTLLLLDYVERLQSIHGFDLNLEALKVGYATAEMMNPPIPVNFVPGNLLSIPCPDSLFDFGMTFHTLEHIYPEDADIFVQEMYRVLKEDSYLLISIPYERAYPDPAHVAFYNVESICELFNRNGFETTECIRDNRWNEGELLTGVFYKPKQL